jgi:hypothetical protein
MKNTTTFELTVRFPSWGENNEYPAYGVKYVVDFPNEIIEDETGFMDYFKQKYDEKIGKGKKFKGEILFIEEYEGVFLK